MPEAIINKMRDFVEPRFGSPRKKFLRDIGAVAVILAFPVLNLGVEDFNWETVIKWTKSDDYYVSRRKIPRKSIKNGVFLGNLSRKEIIAIAYSHRAKGYEEASKLNPKFRRDRD